jgi:hypothetical protein
MAGDRTYSLINLNIFREITNIRYHLLQNYQILQNMERHCENSDWYSLSHSNEVLPFAFCLWALFNVLLWNNLLLSFHLLLSKFHSRSRSRLKTHLVKYNLP